MAFKSGHAVKVPKRMPAGAALITAPAAGAATFPYDPRAGVGTWISARFAPRSAPKVSALIYSLV